LRHRAAKQLILKMEFETINIFVQTTDGRRNQIDISRFSTVANLKEAIRYESGHEVKNQKLMLFGNYELDNCRTLASYELGDYSTLYLVTLTKTATPNITLDCDDEDFIIPTLFVMDLDGKTITLHNVAQSTTVSQVKDMISEKQTKKMPKEEMRLIHVKYQLEDHEMLKKYAIGMNSTMWIAARLRGGNGQKG